MSSPAPAFSRATQGYARIPNSLIESQACLSHAELALLLCILRRGGFDSDSGTIADDHWRRWTGLSPRAKEYAVSGLKAKGVEVKGRGDTARYHFHTEHWERFVTTYRPAKIKTHGRREVEPKPKQKIHEACRDRGCALLSAENSGCAPDSGLSLVPSTQNAQPVAQMNQPAAASEHPRPASGAGAQKQLTVLSATPIAQPVAQTPEAWAKTLAFLGPIFPLAGIEFVIRLLAVVKRLFVDVTDQELATAIERCWSAKQRSQHSEGLFLITVPKMLAVMRNLPKPRSDPEEFKAGPRERLGRSADALAARGAPFKTLAAEVRAAAALLESAAPEWNRIDTEIERINLAIYAAGKDLLTEHERGLCDAETRESCSRAPSWERMTKPQRDQLWQLRHRHTVIEHLALPLVEF